MAARADFFKSVDAQEQFDAQALTDGEKTSQPMRFGPKSVGAPKDLYEICDGRKNRAEKVQQQLRNPAPFGAAAATEAPAAPDFVVYHHQAVVETAVLMREWDDRVRAE